MGLRERLITRIRQSGPLSVADYMRACLYDPEDGYYTTRPRLGAGGDFITAPIVSQMFGEMIALWAIDAWSRLGRPARFRLVELGPGDGAMMSDILRTARATPAFREAAEVWLVETSGPLREAQARALGGTPARWAERIEDLPLDAPMVLVGNEFLDCLPIRQEVVVDGHRAERRIGVDTLGHLAFVGPEAGDCERRPDAEPHWIVESSPALIAFARTLAACLARAGGAALFVDYGSAEPGSGDTLQAVRGHRKESPLAHPGEADLTAHVDFPGFVAAARAAGAQASPIITQGEFLRALGIEARAQALASANPAKADTIARQLHRLIGPDQMGELFKVARIHAGEVFAA